MASPGDVVGHINEVTQRWAGLVLRWATVHGCTVFVYDQTTRPTQPGHPAVEQAK